MKMGRRPRCSSVTYRFRYAPSTASPARTALPAAHFDRNATTPVTDLVHYYLKKRDVNQPRFSNSILAPSMKFSGPCSMSTTQQNVAIAKKVSQSTQRKYRTCR
jgi:hypothetical protein